MKLFALIIDKGQYDESHQYVEGIFSTVEKLEEYKQKFIENIERVKLLPCPIYIEIYNSSRWWEVVSNKEWELVNDWENKINDAKDINQIFMREYELDQEYKEE